MKIHHAVYLLLVGTSLAWNAYNTCYITRKIHEKQESILDKRYDTMHKVLAKESLRRYRYVLNKPENKSDEPNRFPNKIWYYWSSGMENAPSIALNCYNSIKKYIPDMEIITLSKQNVSQYIELPEHILKKYHNGIISEAQFADIVRVFLLREYGGLWLDCTTYLTGSIPIQIRNSDFFAPALVEKGDGRFTLNDRIIPGVFASFFIWVKKPHNYIMECMANFFDEYWKDKEWCDYLSFYEFTAVAMEEDGKFYKQVVDMLNTTYYHENQFLELSYKCHDRYDRKTWDAIKKFPIHKISLAINGKKPFKTGSYYHKIEQGEI